MSILLILPTQLFDYKNIIKKVDQVVIYEEPYYINKNKHPLKLWYHRSTMKIKYKEYQKIHKNVLYVEYDQPLVLDLKKVTMMHPTDKPMIKKYNTALFMETPAFILGVSDLHNIKCSSHASFYKMIRTRINLFVDSNGKPYNNKWSFDTDNRSKFESSITDFKLENKSYKEYLKYKDITKLSSHKLLIDYIPWPISRKESIAHLKQFIINKLDNFGPYQDAINKNILYGYHSIISPMLNIGLLTPSDVVSMLNKLDLKKYKFSSIEGFTRQIIGWREYIRYTYLTKTLKWPITSSNKISATWYNQDHSTGSQILDWSINRVLTYSYVPHIERLMLLLNYGILLELDYKSLHNWFVDMFIDGYDWVMVNVHMSVNSMSTGDKFMKKTYLTNGAYLKRMGLTVSKPDMETLSILYRSFLVKYKKLALKDYGLAGIVKKLLIK